MCIMSCSSSFSRTTIMDPQYQAIIVEYRALAIPLNSDVYQNMISILTHLLNDILTVLNMHRGDAPIDDVDSFVALFRERIEFAWVFSHDHREALRMALISSSFLIALRPAAEILLLLTKRHTLTVQDGEAKLAEAIAEARAASAVFGVDIPLAAVKTTHEPAKATGFAPGKMKESIVSGAGYGIGLSPPGRNLTAEKKALIWAWLGDVVDGGLPEE